jgi:hypothetical protein
MDNFLWPSSETAEEDTFSLQHFFAKQPIVLTIALTTIPRRRTTTFSSKRSCGHHQKVLKVLNLSEADPKDMQVASCK